MAPSPPFLSHSSLTAADIQTLHNKSKIFLSLHLLHVGFPPFLAKSAVGPRGEQALEGAVRYVAPFAYAIPASTVILDSPFLALPDPASQHGPARQQKLGFVVHREIANWLANGAPRIYDKADLQKPGFQHIKIPNMMVRYFCNEIGLQQVISLSTPRRLTILRLLTLPLKNTVELNDNASPLPDFRIRTLALLLQLLQFRLHQPPLLPLLARVQPHSHTSHFCPPFTPNADQPPIGWSDPPLTIYAAPPKGKSKSKGAGKDKGEEKGKVTFHKKVALRAR